MAKLRVPCRNPRAALQALSPSLKPAEISRTYGASKRPAPARTPSIRRRSHFRPKGDLPP